MPGFVSPSLDQTTSIEGRTFEDMPTDARAFDPTLTPPTTTRVTNSSTMQGIDLVRATTSDHTNPKKSVAGIKMRVDTRPAVEASLDLSISERNTSTRALLDTPAASNDAPTPLYKTVVPGDAGIKEVPEAHLEGAEESSSTYRPQIDDLDWSSAKSGEARPTRLEPTPRAILSPLREPVSSEDFQSSDRIEQEPRVVIGRINVEVVPPAAETKTTAPPRPGPLTAESVSVIGPLSRRVGSSLRLNLKYR